MPAVKSGSTQPLGQALQGAVSTLNRWVHHLCAKPKSKGGGGISNCKVWGLPSFWELWEDREKTNKTKTHPTPFHPVSHHSHSYFQKAQLSLLYIPFIIVLLLVGTDLGSVMDFPGALAFVGDDKGKAIQCLPVMWQNV